MDQAMVLVTNKGNNMSIIYSNKIKAYFVIDSKGAVLFRSWTEGVCRDYINDNQG
jgi:hypothetical protein